MTTTTDFYTVARVKLESAAPYSQSAMHDTPMFEGEKHDDYDIRTWRNKATTVKVDGVDYVAIPGNALVQSMIGFAKYSGEQIEGQGKKTWTAKFQAGILPPGPISTGVRLEDVDCAVVWAHANGQRGSGKRVYRRFPILNEWSIEAEFTILDPIITQSVFEWALDGAGMFIGIGRFRPQNGGRFGRFELTGIEWEDRRREDRRRQRMVQRAKASA